MPELSVIIPTYNRCDVLLRTLDAYKRQTARDGILEVIVVDDGSTDSTPEVVAQAALAAPFEIRYLRQNHKGPARGRNYAIRESKGELVLLGDDDVIPHPELVSQHLAWHKKYPAVSDAVLGRIEWSPDIHLTPFTRWFGEYVIFDYRRIRAGQVDFWHFYSCNISLKREFLLQKGTFDEDFPFASYEDIELGYRLTKKGLRLIYNPDALGYHYREMTLADTRRRTEVAEASYSIFRAKMAAQGGGDLVRRDGVTRGLLTRVAPKVLPIMGLGVRIFDTNFPLPRIVYRLFYTLYFVPEAQYKLCRRPSVAE